MDQYFSPETMDSLIQMFDEFLGGKHIRSIEVAEENGTTIKEVIREIEEFEGMRAREAGLKESMVISKHNSILKEIER